MRFQKSIYSDGLLNLADVLVEKEKPILAMRYFNEAIKINPENIGAWQKKAYLLSNLGRHKEVLKSYDEMSTNISWFKDEAIVEKAYHLELIMNKPEEALKCFKEALELKPNYEEAQKLLKKIE